MKIDQLIDLSGQLHLVDASETEELSRQRDALIGQGVQAYQQLQDEFDHELFGRRDLEVLASLMEQKNLLRQRLASYGVQVRA